ncbi:MAG TPA: hypothetical protein VHO48_14655 [Anaerolineaceae bacterium]|nr:hypothetical protein [Anaerolineaceae bacterium]
MAENAEQLTERLTAELRRILAECEDAESAVDVYKTINWAINQVEQVKQEALDLAEQDMLQKGQEDLKTPSGSAGWTDPKVAQLDEDAWRQALAKDANLERRESRFESREWSRPCEQPIPGTNCLGRMG